MCVILGVGNLFLYVPSTHPYIPLYTTIHHYTHFRSDCVSDRVYELKTFAIDRKHQHAPLIAKTMFTSTATTTAIATTVAPHIEQDMVVPGTHGLCVGMCLNHHSEYSLCI
jgi:hypothetical protein